MLEKSILFLKLADYILSFAFWNLKLFISSRINRLTYKAGDNPKNVIVIGASFAGFVLAKQLAQSLPSGYKVVLIEKNSHFYFTWNFPRSSVVPGHDHKAFVPYPKRIPSSPDGIFELKRGNVVSIDTKRVILDDASEIEYEYLVVATGSHARYPAKLEATEKPDCIKYFQDQQEQIKKAQSIVVIGGGAAGMEVASDAKSKYPEKDVTLVHSRDRLLNSFGPGLHARAMEALNELGVKVYLSERAISGLEEDNPREIVLKSGTVLHCDTLVRCTGQHPNSDLIKHLSPLSVSPSGAILVDKCFRVVGLPNPNVFAVGDVVDMPGPRLGRGASVQGMFAADNIIRAIKGKALKEYKPTLVDSSIVLTLGLHKVTNYISDGVRGMAFGGKMHDEDLFAAQMWKIMGAKPYEDPDYVVEDKTIEA